MYCTIPNKGIHIQCSIPTLQPNKRIGIAISFHHLLFLGIAIHFHNEIVIPRTKRGLTVRVLEMALVYSVRLPTVLCVEENK
jgi:hypothetical protein